MNKLIKKLKKKQIRLYSFASNFLDGFLPQNHPLIVNTKYRQRLRIYNSISLMIILLIISFFIFIRNTNNIIILIIYLIFTLVFLVINYINKFKYFQILLLILLLFGIFINFYNILKTNIYPPINLTTLITTIIILHFVYNRWISLLYIVISVSFIFISIFYVGIIGLDFNIIEFRLQYFYNFVFTSIIIWFVLEIYEHFREELEQSLKHINESREKDLELAREIQKQFYPVIPERSNYKMDYLTIPYDKVSGDYIDIINKKDYHWIILGDVTGHGLQSAMLTMQINTLINYLIIEKEYIDMQQIFFELNNHYYKILEKLQIKNYASLIMVKAYEDGNVILTGTIHHIYFYNPKENYFKHYHQSSHLLGLSNLKSKYEIDLLNIKLQNNDILFFCTDGLSEIFLNHNLIINESEFERILKLYFKENVISKNEINLKNLPTFIKEIHPEISFHDDVTAFILQYKKEKNFR